jgi:hypothetical protein
VVICEEVSDEHLVLALCLEEQPEPERVEQRPGEGVNEVDREGCALGGGTGEECYD